MGNNISTNFLSIMHKKHEVTSNLFYPTSHSLLDRGGFGGGGITLNNFANIRSLLTFYLHCQKFIIHIYRSHYVKSNICFFYLYHRDSEEDPWLFVYKLSPKIPLKAVVIEQFINISGLRFTASET